MAATDTGSGDVYNGDHISSATATISTTIATNAAVSRSESCHITQSEPEDA